MSGIGNQNSHTGDSVFENVYIYGDLFHDFDGHNFKSITIENDLSVSTFILNL